MMAFLAEHYRPFSAIAKGTPLEAECHPDYDPTTAILIEGELSYDDGKLRIGFDYGPMFRERHYLYSTIRWIALRVGKKRRLNNSCASLGIDHAVYYYVYDGYEAIPVLRARDCAPKAAQKAGYCIVDEHGFSRWPRPWELRPTGLVAQAIADKNDYWLAEKAAFSSIDTLVHKELKRLSKLWEERNAEE